MARFPSLAWLPITIGLLTLYGPSFLNLARHTWPTDEQGHGPIVLAVAVWLAWQRRGALARLPDRAALVPGIALFALGLVLYAVGRSQSLDTFEVLSLPIVLSALLLLTRGWQGLRLMAFPLFFTLFLVPLPSSLVQFVTGPLKSSVSYVAEQILWHLGYPIARSGTIISIGPYQLLVADACAGLNSMFTLEALGLLYLNLMRYTSVLRNVILAVLTVPIAFLANTIRVVTLTLITFHFGDEAGQGFAHGFAGMVLFMAALVLILVADTLIGRLPWFRQPQRGVQS